MPHTHATTVRRMMQTIVDRETPEELAVAFAENPGQGVKAEEVAIGIMANHHAAIQALELVLARQFIQKVMLEPAPRRKTTYFPGSLQQSGNESRTG